MFFKFILYKKKIQSKQKRSVLNKFLEYEATLSTLNIFGFFLFYISKRPGGSFFGVSMIWSP